MKVATAAIRRYDKPCFVRSRLVRNSAVHVTAERASKLRRLVFPNLDDFVKIPGGPVKIQGVTVNVRPFRCYQFLTNGGFKRFKDAISIPQAKITLTNGEEMILSPNSGEENKTFETRAFQIYQGRANNRGFHLARVCPLEFQPHPFDDLGDDLPKVNLSAEDQEKIGKYLELSLLSEAQFQRMAEGGKPGDPYGGLDPHKIPCYENLKSKGLPSQPVAIRRGPKNAYGIYHPLGLAWVPLLDIYHDNPFAGRAGAIDPVYTGKGTCGNRRVFRGGSWYYYLEYARVGFRHHVNLVNRLKSFGCRFASALPQD